MFVSEKSGAETSTDLFYSCSLTVGLSSFSVMHSIASLILGLWALMSISGFKDLSHAGKVDFIIDQGQVP